MAGAFLEVAGETKEKAEQAADEAVKKGVSLGLLTVKARTEPYQYPTKKVKENPLGEQCSTWWFIGLHLHA